MRRLLLALTLLSGCAVRYGAPSAPPAARRPALRFTVERDVVYARRGDRELTADVYAPEGAGPFPGVVLIHGGGWYRKTDSDMERAAKILARRGYVAVNIRYRLAPEAIFPAQIHDCKEAVRWVRRDAARLKVDPDRIGAFGYSAGAHLAAMLGVTGPGDGLEEPGEASARVQAVVAGGIPADLTRYPKSDMVARFLGTTFGKDPELYGRASPVRYVSADDPPVFLYHGLWDRLVEPEQTRLFQKSLQKAGVPVEVYLLRGMGHVPVYLFNRSALEAGADFLDRSL